ncbi:uncharacterized protein LOC107417290 isoform X2 [Ziziphus jujuba]|uniref:Uncharacterized protein LOC107417290 isoform X2 n=1 Tax=Ziziphus jujuba TaxID=326968 RepID=A0ABM3IGR1_ZIZJJ|nr:uncharacterized protein LOC107417290 isoform X2 [Ziziphus jujuba]
MSLFFCPFHRLVVVYRIQHSIYGGGVQCSSSANRFSSLSHHQKTDQLQRQTTENFYSSSPTYFPVSYNSIDYTIKTTPNLAQSNYYNREMKDPAPDNSVLLSRNKRIPFPTSVATSTENTGSGSGKTAPTNPYFGGMSNMERLPSNFSHQMGHAVVNQGTNSNTATDVRNKAKAYDVPAQKLTIFYGDNVYVYDDISPQQAEVIMSMAKFGSMPSVGEMARSDSQAEAKPLKTNSNSVQYSTFITYLEASEQRKLTLPYNI